MSKVFKNINSTTRLKRFVFRFISVAEKWVYQGRRWILKLYTKQDYELRTLNIGKILTINNLGQICSGNNNTRTYIVD